MPDRLEHTGKALKNLRSGYPLERRCEAAIIYPTSL